MVAECVLQYLDPQAGSPPLSMQPRLPLSLSLQGLVTCCLSPLSLDHGRFGPGQHAGVGGVCAPVPRTAGTSQNLLPSEEVAFEIPTYYLAWCRMRTGRWGGHAIPTYDLAREGDLCIHDQLHHAGSGRGAGVGLPGAPQTSSPEPFSLNPEP